MKGPLNENHSKPKKNLRPNVTASPLYTSPRVEPQPPDRRMADSAASSARTARALRRTATATSPETESPTPPQIEDDAEPIETDHRKHRDKNYNPPNPPPTTDIKGIGFSGFHQRPDLQRDAIGPAEIFSEFSHPSPEQNTLNSARTHLWESGAGDQYRKQKRYSPRIKADDGGTRGATASRNQKSRKVKREKKSDIPSRR
ncbi:Uncharacterized protein Rs2_26919 [Raphanus sativus]|nr:Uncharacterized protein Rs2_26919 [Raphanus sativus]